MTINYITIRYNVTGAERKRLADYIAGFLGCEKKHLGAPTFAYQVGYIEISRDGAITFDDRADSEEIETLLEELEQEGFHAEPVNENAPGEEFPQQDADVAQNAYVGLTVSIPLDKVQVGNLTNLLEAKGTLIKKALGIEATPIEITEDAVSFPWFTALPEPDEADSYTRLIAAMCKMSREQKRISAKAATPENEKYAFRCFLLRLGFIGDEYGAARKILLRNLSGNSAWKGGTQNAASE